MSLEMTSPAYSLLYVAPGSRARSSLALSVSISFSPFDSSRIPIFCVTERQWTIPADQGKTHTFFSCCSVSTAPKHSYPGNIFWDKHQAQPAFSAFKPTQTPQVACTTTAQMLF